MAHIMVVDDDELIRVFLASLLRHVGYSVTEAENGQTCLQKIKTCAVDLVITDIFMPEMDGFYLLTELHRASPDSRMIAISGGYKSVTSQLTLQMAKAFGAIDTIAKPFKTAMVIQQVAKALQMANNQTEPGEAS